MITVGRLAHVPFDIGEFGVDILRFAFFCVTFAPFSLNLYGWTVPEPQVDLADWVPSFCGFCPAADRYLSQRAVTFFGIDYFPVAPEGTVTDPRAVEGF